MKPTLKQILLFALGSLSLMFGLIGIVLPVLPTTPFLLISAYCYLRSSKKLYLWLTHNRLFGKYLYNYAVHHAVPRQTKIVSIIVLWVGLVTSILLVNLLYVRLILVVVGIAVSTHLLSLRTIDAAELQTPPPLPEDAPVSGIES